MIDLARLQALSDMGDAQAAAELHRQHIRMGDAPPHPQLLANLVAAVEAKDYPLARRIVRDLFISGYELMGWLIPTPHPRRGYFAQILNCVPSDSFKIVGKRGELDHFKLARDDDPPDSRRVAIYKRPDQVNPTVTVPLLWGAGLLSCARAEMIRYATHWATRLAQSPEWAHFCANGHRGHRESLMLATTHVLSSQKLPPHALFQVIRDLRHAFGRPDLSPGAVMRCALEGMYEGEDFAFKRGSCTAARMYTRRLVDGVEETGAVARGELARMLVSIYCGCDYRITPAE